MTIKIEDPRFIITEEMYQSCADFAKKSLDSNTSTYARRNQFNREKIEKDIMYGKIGEEGVYEKVSAFYSNLTKPDHNVYEKKDKSWDPDLKDVATGLKIAVKSQDIKSSLAYGESWVFQYNQGKNYDCDTGIFKEEDDKHFAAFVLLNVPKRYGEIRSIVKISWLHTFSLFKDMKLRNLQSNKKAVYYEDLLSFDKKELWQL